MDGLSMNKRQRKKAMKQFMDYVTLEAAIEFDAERYYKALNDLGLLD
jgi:hypothetical protein